MSQHSLYTNHQSLASSARIDVIEALGVSFTRKLSVTPPVTKQVDEVLAACAKTLFAWRTLRQQLPNVIIHDVFQATIVVKLTYASQTRSCPSPGLSSMVYPTRHPIGIIADARKRL